MTNNIRTMHLKLLVISIFAFLCSNSTAQLVQYQNTFDDQTYIVRWIADPAPLDPTVLEALQDDFLADFRSTVLCEMNFGGRQYAWLKFDREFPFETLGGTYYPTINGGVIGATNNPAVDGSSLDYISEHTSTEVMPPSSCMADFDLTIPFGDHPVSLFNLDTGVKMPIDDSSTSELDFSGAITCLEPGNPTVPDTCEDPHGHGTHGAGIQLSLYNQSAVLASANGPSMLSLYSYEVFDMNGEGNMGAILCALSDILTYTSVQRKVVNCSFSFVKQLGLVQDFDPLLDAFTAMGHANIFSVMAAGNDATQIFPPAFDVYPLGYFSDSAVPVNLASSTISVGAANCDFTFANSYSNYSRTYVDVVTIGTLPGPDLNDDPNAGLDYYAGTSQATFATSAVAAMLLSHQASINLYNLKCSMINSSVYDQLYATKNMGAGVMSASTALLLMENGCNIPPSCPEVNVITGNIVDDTYEAQEALYSNGFMNTSDVTFKSGKEITLLAGFSAKPEFQFHVLIEDCN